MVRNSVDKQTIVRKYKQNYIQIKHSCKKGYSINVSETKYKKKAHSIWDSYEIVCECEKITPKKRRERERERKREKKQKYFIIS